MTHAPTLPLSLLANHKTQAAKIARVANDHSTARTTLLSNQALPGCSTTGPVMPACVQIDPTNPAIVAVDPQQQSAHAISTRRLPRKPPRCSFVVLGTFATGTGGGHKNPAKAC